jgi:hypothetical protein
MIIYKVFYKNYELNKGELMATLTERRKGSRGRSQLESGIRWAKSMFGKMVKDKNAIFVVPDKLIWKEDSMVPVEKLLFTEEYLQERRINSDYPWEDYPYLIFGRERVQQTMATYEFYLNDDTREFHLLGILYERRKDPVRISHRSIMNWGKLIVGHYVDINNIYFIEIEVHEGLT